MLTAECRLLYMERNDTVQGRESDHAESGWIRWRNIQVCERSLAVWSELLIV